MQQVWETLCHTMPCHNSMIDTHYNMLHITKYTGVIHRKEYVKMAGKRPTFSQRFPKIISFRVTKSQKFTKLRAGPQATKESQLSCDISDRKPTSTY